MVTSLAPFPSWAEIWEANTLSPFITSPQPTNCARLPQAKATSHLTCFFTFSISERILWMSRVSSEISFLVFLRSSPCRPAASCNSWNWGPKEQSHG